MFLTIDKFSSEPIYLQIRSQIVSAIAKGELVQGDALPSVRNMARDLGVNLHTVNKAYAMLQDDGYAMMNGRKGTIVCVPNHAADSQQFQDIQNRTLATLSQLATEYRASGGSAKDFVALAQRAVEEGK